MIDTKKLNEGILKLWKEKDNLEIRGDQWPELFPPFKEGTILFIGLNPSLRKEDTGKYKLNDEKDLDVKEKIEQIINYEKDARKEAPYFERFRKIIKYLGLNFDHLDLYFYRKAKGEDLIKMTKDPQLKKFFEAQLKISLDFLKLLKPKAIFVNNIFASNKIEDNSKIDINEAFKIDGTEFKENGFDFISLGSSKVPIFFSGMITGQRSIDKQSLRRLNWHLEKAVKLK